MDRKYDPTCDYRTHPVDDTEPSIRLRDAATLLGLRSNEGVRRLITQGRLPAHRGQQYNAPWMVPRWAVEGLCRHRGRVLDAPLPNRATLPSRAEERVATLETAMALLVEARDHEVRAFQLQQEMAAELQAANSALSKAITNAIVPASLDAL